MSAISKLLQTGSDVETVQRCLNRAKKKRIDMDLQWHRLYDLPLSDDKNDMALFSETYWGYFLMNSRATFGGGFSRQHNKKVLEER